MTEDLLKEYIRSSWQLLQDHPRPEDISTN